MSNVNQTPVPPPPPHKYAATTRAAVSIQWYMGRGREGTLSHGEMGLDGGLNPMIHLSIFHSKNNKFRKHASTNLAEIFSILKYFAVKLG